MYGERERQNKIANCCRHLPAPALPAICCPLFKENCYPNPEPHKKSLARRPGITNLSIHTSFLEVYLSMPEAGFLASGCIHPPGLPGLTYQASDFALGGMGDGTPVTVAGPRRIHTGFPCCAPFQGHLLTIHADKDGALDNPRSQTGQM